MPRPRKGARLYLRQRGNSRVWVILDGERQIATGASASELGKAEAELARYIGGRPKCIGPRDPAAVTIAEVIAVYSEQRGQHVRSSATLASGVERLLTFFTTEKCIRLTPSRCDEYVEWRCAQDDRRGIRSRGKVKPPTARRELAVLSSALTWAWRNRVITEHIPIRLPPKSEPRQRHLTRVGSGAALSRRSRMGSQNGEAQPPPDQQAPLQIHFARSLYRDPPQGDPRAPMASEHDRRMGRPRVRSASPAGSGRVRERETKASHSHPREADHAPATLAAPDGPARDRAQRHSDPISNPIVMGRSPLLSWARRCRDPAHSTAHVRDMDAPCRSPYVAGGRRPRRDGRDCPEHLRAPRNRISPGCRRRLLAWQRLAKKPLKKTG